jgi:hypothetical protein
MSNIEGKDENSKGLDTLIEIIIMTSPSTMFMVNMTSSKKAGIGITSIASIRRINPGTARPSSRMDCNTCLKFDIRRAFIINDIKQWVINSLSSK